MAAPLRSQPCLGSLLRIANVVAVALVLPLLTIAAGADAGATGAAAAVAAAPSVRAGFAALAAQVVEDAEQECVVTFFTLANPLATTAHNTQFANNPNHLTTCREPQKSTGANPDSVC